MRGRKLRRLKNRYGRSSPVRVKGDWRTVSLKGGGSLGKGEGPVLFVLGALPLAIGIFVLVAGAVALLRWFFGL